jgi:programmed cell death protein 4
LIRCNVNSAVRWCHLRFAVSTKQTLVASFLARAVVDEVLPPAFLSEQNNARPGDEVVEKTVSLLSREHCNARLERVWGPGDGRPVAELKTNIDILLKEYLFSRELDEAARCVRELEAPHFHHELVKRGVFAAMEEDGKETDTSYVPSNIDAMAALFVFLVTNAIVSESQIKRGIRRLHDLLPDLSLDVPSASSLLSVFENLLASKGMRVVPSMDEKKTD